MKRRAISVPATAAACALALVAAQSASAAKDDATWVDIKTWESGAAYDGWSAEKLLDEEVYGANGEEIGEVEDLIVGPDGKIESVIVEGGGFLDIGDSHVAVPWDQVKRVGTSSIAVPIKEDNLDDYGMFKDFDDKDPKPKRFRVRELMGDNVTANGVGYGMVTDVIFSKDGAIQSIIVMPSHGYGYARGPFPLPYYADYYDPYQPYYDVPYAVEDLNALKPFDYSQLD